MKISQRLKAIVDLIETPYSVIDVGTDHAYLPIYLAQNYECQKLIASELNIKPYQAALKNIEQEALSEEIEVRSGPGLSVLEVAEVKTVVIAGMGARTMIEILIADEELTSSIEQFILQPMNGSAILREWLISNDFRIADEDLIKEGSNFYEIIMALPGQEVIAEEFLLEIGPRLREKEVAGYRDFLLSKEQKWQYILKRLPQKEIQELQNKRAILEDKLLKLREVIRCL